MSGLASRRLLGAFAGLVALGVLSGCAEYSGYDGYGTGYGGSYYSPGYAYGPSIGLGLGFGGFGWGGDGDFDGD